MSAQDPEDLKRELGDDAVVLASLGRKDVLERNWGFWNILGFAVTNLCSWEFAVPYVQRETTISFTNA